MRRGDTPGAEIVIRPTPTSLSPTLLYNPITTKLPLVDVIDPFAYIR